MILIIALFLLKYKVIDLITNQPTCHFYTDLHPRDGKYGHAAVFEIIVNLFFFFLNNIPQFKNLFNNLDWMQQATSSLHDGL